MLHLRALFTPDPREPPAARASDEDIDQFLTSLRSALHAERPADISGFVHGYCRQRLSVDTLSPWEQAALLCDAAAHGNVADVEWLLQRGLDPNTCDYDLRTPLHLAAEEFQLECVELLLAGQADVNAADRWGTTPLSGVEALIHMTDDPQRVEKVAKLLRNSGGELTDSPMSPTKSRHSSGTCLAKERLHTAACFWERADVAELLDDGASVNLADADGRTALFFASDRGRLDIVKLLVERRANLDDTDRFGQSAAMRAELHSHFNIVSFLRDAGAAPAEDEPKSFEAYAGIAKRWWEKHLCEEAEVPVTADVVPSAVLRTVLERNYGFDLTRHQVLSGELEELESTDADGNSEIHRATFMRRVLQVRLQRCNSGVGVQLCGSTLFPSGKSLVNIPSVKSLARIPSRGSVRDLMPKVQSKMSHDSFGTEELPDKADSGVCSNVLGRVVLGKLAIKSWTSFRSIVEDIFKKVLDDESLRDGPDAGHNADYIPELRDAPSDRLALSICTVDGQICSFGEADEFFSIQSTGKSFAYSLAIKEHAKAHNFKHACPEGADYVHTYVGREPSGRAFNDFALTRPDAKGVQHPFNPVTNAGSIVTCSMIDEHNPLPLVPGDWKSPRMESRVQKYKDFLQDLSGGARIGDCLDVFVSEQQEAFNNYALANFMMARGTFPPNVKTHDDLREAVDFYLRMCSTRVNARILAAVGATYSTFGCSPLTGKRVTTMTEAKQTLAILASCGMYDFSGEWACTVGLPAKSGVSGNIFIVIPGMMGLCVWSPRLDSLGNSVRGVRIAQKLKAHLSCSVLDLLSRSFDHR